MPLFFLDLYRYAPLRVRCYRGPAIYSRRQIEPQYREQGHHVPRQSDITARDLPNSLSSASQTMPAYEGR